MDKNCHGKVRYVGGWVIAKLIQANRKYINTNISSTNMLVKSEMNELIKLLESLLMHSSTVHNKSEYLGSLEFTDLKQFRDNTLVYISDETFIFFMELEQLRVTLLCQSKLYLLKSDLLTMAVSTVKQNQNLLGHWTSLFEEHCCKNLLKDLFCQAVDKYFHMGCGQFLRDFKRDHNVKKNEAHRKRVVERRPAKQQKDDKITIKCLSEDQSSNKQYSHRLLVAIVTKQPGVFNSSVYNKNEIKHIYKAYGIKYVARWNKSQLNDYLVKVELTPQFFFILNKSTLFMKNETEKNFYLDKFSLFYGSLKLQKLAQNIMAFVPQPRDGSLRRVGYCDVRR